jgi:hypothetical protein
MTVFQIKSSRSAKSGKLAEFDVAVVSGEVSPGCEFLLFETHHPCNFVVKQVKNVGELTTLQVHGIVPWDNRWRGAMVDTENPDAAKKYGYSSGNE